MYVFRNLTEVRQLTESWMTEYNDERPHDSLEDPTPWEYLAKHPSYVVLKLERPVFRRKGDNYADTQGLRDVKQAN
jgi:hypothetical protein